MLSEPLVFSPYCDDSAIETLVMELEQLGLSTDANIDGTALNENDLVGGAGGGNSSVKSMSSRTA